MKFTHLGRHAVATVAIAGALSLVVDGRESVGPQSRPARHAGASITRAPIDEIHKHIDRDWIAKAATRDLMDYWFAHSVEANGFIQENLDRQWKPWGTQREASINGQGRQLYSMAVGYEMAPSKAHLDALTRGTDFLVRMRDPEFGGYYDRVSPTLEVINENKTGFSSFALFSLAHAGRVTGDRKYLDAAMVWFREMRDNMRDGPFVGSGSYSRDFMQRLPGGMFGGAARPGQTPPAGAAMRRHGINLHAFEALLALYDVTGSEEVWYEITKELKAIERLYDYTIGYLPESYDDNWKPVGNPSGNPGHLFEWASLLSRAVELGADPKFVQLGSRSLDLGLKSYDDAIGGLGATTPDGKPARMLWWPQCEVIKATANYAILHGRGELWPTYRKTWEFVKKEYFDTEHGGWFADVVPGQPRAERGEKAFYKGSVDGPEWGAYHMMSMYHDLWRITDPKYTTGPVAKGGTR
jgi:mannose/cellobiose epimerase-like protein (N-acyl-D-glucosamine 2-epimerase family)